MNVFRSLLSAVDSTVLQNLESTSCNIFNTISMYIYIAIGFAMVGCGCLYIFGSERGKEKANAWLPRIVIGSGFIICAVSISQYLVGIWS